MRPPSRRGSEYPSLWLSCARCNYGCNRHGKIKLFVNLGHNKKYGLEQRRSYIVINGHELTLRFCAILRYTFNFRLYILKDQHQKKIRGIKENFFSMSLKSKINYRKKELWEKQMKRGGGERGVLIYNYMKKKIRCNGLLALRAEDSSAKLDNNTKRRPNRKYPSSYSTIR